MDRILTVEQMTFCEHEAEKYGVSLAQLMDNAAAQLAEVIASNSSASSKIVLLIGKGNNGGKFTCGTRSQACGGPMLWRA